MESVTVKKPGIQLGLEYDNSKLDIHTTELLGGQRSGRQATYISSIA